MWGVMHDAGALKAEELHHFKLMSIFSIALSSLGGERQKIFHSLIETTPVCVHDVPQSLHILLSKQKQRSKSKDRNSPLSSSYRRVTTSFYHCSTRKNQWRRQSLFSNQCAHAYRASWAIWTSWRQSALHASICIMTGSKLGTYKNVEYWLVSKYIYTKEMYLKARISK